MHKRKGRKDPDGPWFFRVQAVAAMEQPFEPDWHNVLYGVIRCSERRLFGAVPIRSRELCISEQIANLVPGWLGEAVRVKLVRVK